ncbi:hypothetical protein NFX31_10640 [Microbacterium azadirachtae]|uniref:hypothetical protein n=1 Tax=Microbacterium azadirachtae TaxID=582680 RepID=UPI0021D4F8F4|nr:hypothetical protein [Microbacterium azadirachtae]UXW84695.1 hypothetical protein NFX31_10640 [Microbacterium azadirachtae]
MTTTSRLACGAVAVLTMIGLAACAPTATTASSPTPSASPAVSPSTPPVSSPPASSSAPAEDPSSPSTWIISTAGVGAVRLGDKVSALPDLAGWSIRDSCRWAALWGDSELQLVAAGDSSESEPVVSEIAVLGSTTGPRPQTDSGVGVGSTEEQVRAAYPGAAEGTSGYGPWIRTGDPAQGAVYFTLYPDSRTVRQVTVTTRDKPSAEYCG